MRFFTFTLCVIFLFGCGKETLPKKGFKRTIGTPVPPLSKGLISGSDGTVCVLLKEKLHCFSEPNPYFSKVYSNMGNEAFRVAAITNNNYRGDSYKSICGITKDDKISCFRITTGEVEKIRAADPSHENFDAIYGNLIFCSRYEDGKLFCFDPQVSKKYDAANPPGPYKGIALGWDLCGLKANGETECFDAKSEVQVPVIDDPQDYFKGQKLKSLAIADRGDLNTFCALDDKGMASCFRIKDVSKLAAPPHDTKWQEISAIEVLKIMGTNYIAYKGCGLDEAGVPWCFDPKEDKTFAEAQKESFLSVRVGRSFSCGIKTNQEKICWKNIKSSYPVGIPNDLK